MRDFLKYTFASFLGLVLFFTLGIGGFILLLAVITTASRHATPSVQDDSILGFDLSVNITDAPAATPSDVLGAVLSNGDADTISLRVVLDALKSAAEDDRIVGLYLYGRTDPTESGFATLREVRQAMQAFQAAGKPIFAYETDWVERDYYLTSLADTIALNPTGLFELNGFRAETTFFAGALEKYGIGIQTIRAGQYKSAVEPFVRTESSPQERQQTQKLLADIWGEFLATVAESRDLTPQQLQAIADNQGALLPDEALEAGLVDKVVYADEVVTELRALTGEEGNENEEGEEEEDESFRQVDLLTYAETIAQDANADSDNQIAIVYAEGSIVSGEGDVGQIGGDRFARQLRELRLDEDVKAVVLRVNSPGGSATASEVIAREVLLTSQEKPVIVSMGSFAASGGYLIATYGDQIFASPNTITGSIGVFGLLPNVQEIANNNGITWDVVKTGRFADIDTISRPKTPEELAIGQRIVDRIYERFLNSVADSRSIPRQRVAEVAQGRVWSGVEAERLGLVDELGGLEAAIQAAAEQAELEDDWRLEEYPKNRSLEEQILELFGSRLARETSPSDPLSLELQKLRADLKILQSLNDPLGIYTRLPSNPWID